MNSAINILLFFIFIVMLVVAFVAVNVYIGRLSMDDIKTSFMRKDSTPNTKSRLDVDDYKSTWVNSFASKNIPGFSYPSLEFSIVLDFSNAKKTDTLRISNLDSYKFFCLNEVLKSNNIKFTYIKTADFVTLEVALNKNGLREKLTNELKKYNISYHIQ